MPTAKNVDQTHDQEAEALRLSEIKLRKEQDAAAAIRAKKRYIINVSLGNDNEDQRVFIGGMQFSGDTLIVRGQDVEVSQEVIDRLEDARMYVDERRQEGDQFVVTHVERKRFPYTIVKVL